METQSQENRLVLDDRSIQYLEETRKWTLFFSIVGFVVIGLMILMFVFINPWRMGMASAMPAPIAGFGMGIGVFFLLVMMALYFFPIFFLYKFSYYAKLAIQQMNSGHAAEAFRYLKYHYKFIGILTIVILGIYVLIFIIAMLAGGLSRIWM